MDDSKIEYIECPRFMDDSDLMPFNIPHFMDDSDSDIDPIDDPNFFAAYNTLQRIRRSNYDSMSSFIDDISSCQKGLELAGKHFADTLIKVRIRLCLPQDYEEAIELWQAKVNGKTHAARSAKKERQRCKHCNNMSGETDESKGAQHNAGGREGNRTVAVVGDVLRDMSPWAGRELRTGPVYFTPAQLKVFHDALDEARKT